MMSTSNKYWIFMLWCTYTCMTAGEGNLAWKSRADIRGPRRARMRRKQNKAHGPGAAIFVMFWIEYLLVNELITLLILEGWANYGVYSVSLVCFTWRCEWFHVEWLLSFPKRTLSGQRTGLATSADFRKTCQVWDRVDSAIIARTE